MKKIIRNIGNKIIYSLIILLVIFIYACPNYIEAYTKRNYYLAMGDSIAEGYALADQINERYSKLIQNEIKAEGYNNIAVSGMTCEEFYQYIQTGQFHGIQKVSDITNEIRKADIMTVSIGSNELLGMVTRVLKEATGVQTETADPAFMSKIKEAVMGMSWSEFQTFITTLYNFFSSDETQTEITNAVNKYETNWNNSVNYIKSINPNIKIIATEFYNPYYSVDLSVISAAEKFSSSMSGMNSKIQSISTFVDNAIKQLNTKLTNQSQNETRYKIAKIYDDFNTKNPRLTNVNTKLISGIDLTKINWGDTVNTLKDSLISKVTNNSNSSSSSSAGASKMSEVVSSEFNLDPHPNKTGHEKIKTRILEQLTIIEKEEAASSNNNNNNNDNNNNEDNTVQRIDISKMTISDISDQIYTGSEIKPSVTIKNGNNVLKENQDYTLIYHNNINVGEAKVMITGIGNYQGTAEKTFNIKEQSRSLTDISTCTLEEIGSYTYTGIEITPMIVIKDGETELVYETDFDVKYQDNINAGTAKVIIEGIGNYKGSKESTFVIDKKSIEECDGLKIEDQVYTGNPITPEIVLKLGSTELVKDKDYTLSYSNNTNVGEARAVISGIGNFKNTVNLLFNIVSNEATPTKTNITTCSITNPADATYTGSILNPKPRIEDGTKVLEEGVDYTATYTDNVNVGTAHVRLSGIGDYIGEANVTFKVNAQPITYNKVKDIKTQRYTGSEIKPTVVIYSDSIILKEGIDYTVRYENNINPGTANIVITGKGNYSGTMNKTFIIEGNNSGTTTITTNTSLEERDITIANKDIPQTGIVGFVKYIVITGLVGLFFYIKYKKEEIK